MKYAVSLVYIAPQLSPFSFTFARLGLWRAISFSTFLSRVAERLLVVTPFLFLSPVSFPLSCRPTIVAIGIPFSFGGALASFAFSEQCCILRGIMGGGGRVLFGLFF